MEHTKPKLSELKDGINKQIPSCIGEPPHCSPSNLDRKSYDVYRNNKIVKWADMYVAARGCE